MPEQDVKTKSAVIRDHMGSGDWRRAIACAAKLPRLDVHRCAILDARLGYTHPGFCRQLGRDPAALIAAGKAALIERFGPSEARGQ